MTLWLAEQPLVLASQERDPPLHPGARRHGRSKSCRPISTNASYEVRRGQSGSRRDRSTAGARESAGRRASSAGAAGARRRSDLGAGAMALLKAGGPRRGARPTQRACAARPMNCIPPSPLRATGRSCSSIARPRSLTMRTFSDDFLRSLSRQRSATRSQPASAAIRSKARASNCSSTSSATITPFSDCRCCPVLAYLRRAQALAQ